MNAQKPDAPQIESFLRSLADSLSLDPLRAWWPDFLFHTTELHNAVAILDSGFLLSREDVGDEMAWDNANREIIARTPDDVKQKARFYFRPRTPMTHNNEGFRTRSNRHPLAYCPFPVMLILPSLPILTAVGTEFSDGNCSSRGTQRGSSADFFRALPFADIYHDERPASEEGERIRHHRQAEVLAPSPFDIRSHHLRVRVRSIAERETLLSQLQQKTVEHYRNTIQISNQAPLFHKNWTYIESTSALEDALTIRFNASTQERNSFHIRMTFSKPDGRVVTVREGVSPAFGSLRVSLSERDLREPFHLRIELDGDLAFSGMLDPRTDQIVRSVT